MYSCPQKEGLLVSRARDLSDLLIKFGQAIVLATVALPKFTVIFRGKQFLAQQTTKLLQGSGLASLKRGHYENSVQPSKARIRRLHSLTASIFK